MKKFLIFFAIFLAVTLAVFFGRQKDDFSEVGSPEIVSEVSQDLNEEMVEIEEEVVKEEELPKLLPKSALIQAPFLSQAPFAVWDALHEDACEEASLVMVKYAMENKKEISLQKGDDEIKGLVSFQEKNGYGLSITLQELSEVARDYYGMKTGRVEENISIEDIKREISEGRLVIVGAAGKILPNPNFKNGGPNYHMLVVKGYDENGFITNDPGTRKGENFRYTFESLFYSIHDWNEENILKGEKNYLVFD